MALKCKDARQFQPAWETKKASGYIGQDHRMEDKITAEHTEGDSVMKRRRGGLTVTSERATLPQKRNKGRDKSRKHRGRKQEELLIESPNPRAVKIAQ